MLILCEVLRWKASEVAELLETSVASVNSALQRARATLEESEVSSTEAPASVDEADADLLARYVRAFEDYDMDALTTLIREDATQSMPPYDMWLRPRRHLRLVVGPPDRLRGLRVIPTVSANGSPAFGPVQAEPGRRPRAVGAAGAGDRGGGIADLVLPRHRHALPAVRPAAAAGLVARSFGPSAQARAHRRRIREGGLSMKRKVLLLVLALLVAAVTAAAARR